MVTGYWLHSSPNFYPPASASTVTLWNLSPLSQLPAFFLLGLLVTILQKAMLALPSQSLTHSSTNSDLPLYLMTCILLQSFFVSMPKLSLIWPLGVALCMFLWPLACSQQSASSPLLPGNIGLSWSLPGVSRSFKDLWYL